MTYAIVAALAASVLAGGADAFYLPGTSPKSFKEGESVKLKVNKMTSTKTLLPIDYYKLPFCRPEGEPKMDNENLGEFLAGDRIENSPYLLFMQKEIYCAQLCWKDLGAKEVKGMKANKVVRAIRKEYHNNWIVDNLSAASKVEDDDTVTTRYWQGFPIGFISENSKEAFIHNHVNIEIDYHPVDGEENAFRVVRFTVEPFSISHDFKPTDTDGSAKSDTMSDDEQDQFIPEKVATIKNPIPSCDPKISYADRKHTDYDMVTDGRDPQPASGKVLFTYDVHWVRNEKLKWASRWDIYLSMDNAIPAKVHWLSIANSIVIVCVLSAMIIAILVRNLRQDLARYNRLATDEEKADDLEEKGWKLVHADVFRPPSHVLALSVACGTGAQLLCMAFWTIIFSALGFLSPARRGALLMAELLFFVLMGTVAGYVTARLYKALKGKAWQYATVCTAVAFPGFAFTLFFMMDIMAWTQGSSDAVPFTTILVLLLLWFGISTPLVFLGAYFGYKQEPIEYPVKTSSIPRQVPDQPWFMSLPFTLLISGILPFGACFVELYFIMASVWMDYYYYVFGFLLLVFAILIITCAEITLLFNYFLLCNEDYHWWWRSFFTSGSMAFWVFLYSFVYFQQLEANSFATYFLYFGYMGLASVGLFLATGFIGVASSLWFNITIFGSLKVD